MKRLFASTALALICSSAAFADEVVIRQDFDLGRIPQMVINKLDAGLDVTTGVMDGTNLQNVLQWRDASTDAGLKGDIYKFDQFTDEEQLVLNSVSSKYGDVGAKLSATNVQNLVELEDKLGGTELVGDHILIDQLVLGNLQVGSNELKASYHGDILAGSAAEVTNLSNVADITDQYGAQTYGNVIRLDQKAGWTTQLAENTAKAGHDIKGLEMSGLNGINIASFDLKSQTGEGDIGIEQVTRDVTQVVANTATAAGAAANVKMSGTNLGNVITFAAAPAN